MKVRFWIIRQSSQLPKLIAIRKRGGEKDILYSIKIKNIMYEIVCKKVNLTYY